MNIDLERKQDFALLKVSGDIERMPDCNKLCEEMTRLVDEKTPHVVLDLRDTEFVSSSFCGFLVSAVKKGAKAASRFSVIVSQKSTTNEVFSIAGIDLLVPVYHSLDEMLNRPGRKLS